jgi:hypothetical protein
VLAVPPDLLCSTLCLCCRCLLSPLPLLLSPPLLLPLLPSPPPPPLPLLLLLLQLLWEAVEEVQALCKKCDGMNWIGRFFRSREHRGAAKRTQQHLGVETAAAACLSTFQQQQQHDYSQLQGTFGHPIYKNM